MIYLDNNATTRMTDNVRSAMAPFLDVYYANPSSPYMFARHASNAVARAREALAELLGAAPAELLFTSGGTEANNLALYAALAAHPERRQVVASAVEHPSVREPLRAAGARGHSLTLVPVDEDGRLDFDALQRAVNEETAVVAVMSANNETGVLYEVERVAALAHERGAHCHCDAVQSVGKLPVNVRELGVDSLSVSAHKLHGPKGIGALFMRGGRLVQPLLRGGEQEAGRRAGTENVAGIVGLGEAARMACEALPEVGRRVAALRDDLEEGLLRAVPGLRVAGGASPRLPNTSLVLLDKIEADAVLALLDMEGICCSSGSACASGSAEPSHVLQAMGLAGGRTQAAIRFSLSRLTGREEVETARERVATVLQALVAGD